MVEGGVGMYTDSGGHPRIAEEEQMSRVTAIELDYRQCAWVEVSLLWDRETDELIVSVRDSESSEAFELTVENNGKALDAFHHPYDYAPKPAAAAAQEASPVRSARVTQIQ